MKLLFRRFNPISDIFRPFDCGNSARGGRCVIVDATICERREKGGQAEGPSRDGVCLTTVRLALARLKGRS